MDIKDLAGIQEVHSLVAKAKIAQEKLSDYSQQQIDQIITAMAKAGNQAAEHLARIAAGETGMGRVESKIAKNRFASTEVFSSIINLKTVGILGFNAKQQCYEIAEPVGVVAAVIPTTNPTSTAIFKSLISVKSRNTVIFAPHPKAIHCTAETVKILNDAAVAAGAPQDCLQCITQVSLAVTQELMTHPDIDFILATGGPGLVKAAYQSGKPAIGVGQGNAPVYIDRSANLAYSARCVVESKTFDYGTICSSEQSILLDQPIYQAALAEFKKLNAYLLSKEELEKLSRYAILYDRMNPDVVGQSAFKIAEKAGISVPSNTTVLLGEVDGVGPKYALSHEILAPILAVYKVSDWKEGCSKGKELLDFEGIGHTFVVHATNPDVILQFGLQKPVSRLIVNAPSSQGGVGLATRLVPSLTLGCGTEGGNITSDNISAHHLINIKRVAAIRADFPLWGRERSINQEMAQLRLTEDVPIKLPPLEREKSSTYTPATNSTPNISSFHPNPEIISKTPELTLNKSNVSPSSLKNKDPWQVKEYAPPTLERFRDVKWP